jgi:thymidylate synthase (FAD)
MNTAKIIAVTDPWIDTKDGHMTANEFIAYVARVSNPSNQMNTESSSKLLRYLAKHKHWSPFEMVDVVMEINTTRDIGRQILRHRSFSFQEFSQRYADPTKDMGFVTREARLQDTKNRQNSIETTDSELDFNWRYFQEDLYKRAADIYKKAIDAGIAKEQARAVLPEGLTMSRMYMKGSLRSWIHYVTIRASKETQKEHREIAIQAKNEIVNIFPSLSELFDDSLDY